MTLHAPLIHRALHASILCSVLVLLAGCVQTPSPTPAATATRLYVANLSKANFVLDGTPEALTSAKSYLRKMNAYAQNSRDKGTGRAVDALVLNVRMGKEHRKHTVLVPVAADARGGYDFKLLEQTIAAVDARKPEYMEILANTLTVTERPSIRLSRTSDPEEVAEHVHEWHSNILASAEPMPPLSAAQLQLEAARYFMNAGQRDAAYLALGNAKTSLADADTEDADDPKAVTRLSAQLVELENTLHKKLPYNL